MKRVGGLQSALGLSIAEHVQGDAMADVQARPDTVDRLLHLAVTTVAAFDRIGGRRQGGFVLGVMEPNFLMGSMGAVVGEKFCIAVEKAIEESLPLVVVACSGGARMHEGVVSLGQMAKTSAALARYDEAKGLFISVLADPTTGGVTASFAMLGDVIIAEPGALIGFAGRRTIAKTIKVELPEDFQTAEFMLEHGFIDMIVPRKDLRSEITRIIDYCQK